MAKIISTHSLSWRQGQNQHAANLAAMIARAGYRVGVLDTDIQSPGIHVFFRPSGAVENALNNYLWGQCGIEQAATT